MPVQTISGISYINESFVGNGFVLVGDASMFVDPIFSAGVTLAVRGGIYAADTILDAFQRRDFSAARPRLLRGADPPADGPDLRADPPLVRGARAPEAT